LIIELRPSKLTEILDGLVQSPEKREVRAHDLD